MTTPVPLYQPLNTLKPGAENIWIADGGLTWMNMGILRAPFSTRMTLVRLADGSLWCHSPIAPDDALFAAVDALGTVRHLVSPNYIHYAHIPAWQARYPQVTAWQAPACVNAPRKTASMCGLTPTLATPPRPPGQGRLRKPNFAAAASCVKSTSSMWQAVPSSSPT